MIRHTANANYVTEAYYNWDNYDSEALGAVNAWSKDIIGLL